MSIIERVRSVAKNEKNLQAFADRIGQKEPSIRSMLSRGSNPSYSYIHSIIKAYPNLNARWLITGEGQMWLTGEGNIIGNNNQVVTGNGSNNGNYNINTINEELITLREQNKSLQEQLKLKNEQLQLKDELIQLLKEK